MAKLILLVTTSLIFLALLIAGVSGVFYLKELGVFSITDEQLLPITTWHPEDNTIIYDRHNQKIAEFYTSYHIYVPFAAIPKPMVQAIVAIEDRNFWTHPGMDLKGILRAALIYLREDSFKQGASTITQQIVRHFLLPKDKTLPRKIREIFLAMKLETLMSKESIFEIYTNAMFMGHGSYGVAAASQRYFRKDLSELALHECALIAGLFQSPSRYNPHKNPQLAKARQRIVLQAMVEAGYLTQEEADSWFAKPLNYQTYIPSQKSMAPYFVDYVKKAVRKILGQRHGPQEGLRIYTTLDPKLQTLGERAIRDAAPRLTKLAKELNPTKTIPVEAAILVLDSRTGEILAMQGGRDYHKSQFNRTVSALRQPGSSFKPIIYSLALARGYKWSDLIYVAPLTLAGTYRPRGSSADYLTETTMLKAFYRSMNSPTLEIGERLGILPIIQHAKQFGITTPIKQEYGSILGSSETTMLDLAQMYAVFANDGKRQEITSIRRITDSDDNPLFEGRNPSPVRVLPSTINFLMQEGLRNVLTQGTGSRAKNLSAFAAGKTGTSNGGKDNWFCGFTSELTAVVWVGSDDETPLGEEAQGSTLALPIWQKFMEDSSADRQPIPFAPIAGVIELTVHPEYGYPTPEGIPMWFMEDNLPKEHDISKSDLENSANFRDPFSKSIRK